MQNHPIPKDAIVIEMAEHLGADDREAFEERAAIIEYDGHLPRAHAECLALLAVLRRDALAGKGVVVLQAEIDGGTEWLLTTDLAFARAQLADIGGREVAVLDPVERSWRRSAAASQSWVRLAKARQSDHLIWMKKSTAHHHVKESRNEESSTENTSSHDQGGSQSNHQGHHHHHRATPAHPEDRPLPDGLREISGKSALTYHLGCTPESVIKIRLYGNTGNGFLNQDWIAWTAIQEKLELHSPFTSQVLHALFSGKSLNSPGFLMAVLKAEGVVKASTVKGRCYELTKDAGFLAEM